MKTISLCLLTLFMCIGCIGSNAVDPNADASLSDSDNPATALICGKKDPVKELEWLNRIMTFQTTKPEPGYGALTPFKIVAYSYRGSTVIENESMYHSSPYIHVYNCDGSGALKPEDSYNTYQEKRQKIRILYDFRSWWD